MQYSHVEDRPENISAAGIAESDEDDIDDMDNIPVTNVYPVLTANIVTGQDEDVPRATVIYNEATNEFVSGRDDSMKYWKRVLLFFRRSSVLDEKGLMLFVGLVSVTFFAVGLIFYTVGKRQFDDDGKEHVAEATVKWNPSLELLQGTEARQYLGAAIAVSNDGKRLAAMSLSGKLIFEDNGTDWVQIGQTVCLCKDYFGEEFDLTLPKEVYEFHLLGFAIESSFDGNRFVIGFAYDDFGIAAVIDWNEQTQLWDTTQLFTGESRDEGFGSNIEISYDGHRIAVVSLVDKSITICDYVETNSTSSYWDSHVITLTEEEILKSTNSKFISLSGNGKRLAIGSLEGVKVMEEKEYGQWVQMGRHIFGRNIFDKFGEAIDLTEDGSRIVIGAPGFSEGYVCAYDYLEEENEWVQFGKSLIGADPGDRFGFSVSISSDGTTLAVGAFGGGPSLIPGYVTLYELVSGVWTQIGDILEGQEPGDRFGFAVKISGDKNRVLASAIMSKANGIERSGQIATYDLEPYV